MKKIWIVGSLGHMGQALIRLLDMMEYELYETDKDELDITDEHAVSLFMHRNRPDVVINCAGYHPSAGAAQSETDMAYKVNAVGARNLAQSAESIQAKLIQISTDDVFSSASDTPYNEFDDVNPVGLFAKSKYAGEKFVIQISPNDCTGCTLCADVCPAKSKTDPTHKALTMVPAGKIHDKEEANWNFFLSLPDVDRTKVRTDNIRSMQVLRPLFEFSGACAGCGETPYVKMLSQLFGNRLVVANATGCSSIYGGNLPTTPWSHDSEGRGPAWANSLFEDNAEFGLGFRVSLDKQMEHAIELLHEAAGAVGQELVDRILANPQKDEADIAQQRENIEELKKKIAGKPEYARLLALADKLVRKSVWILGGDGWAYDIGYGGLDHILASGRNVKVLVMDTEVYSNTGGQCSKSTPRAAVAKFATTGKPGVKKDLGLMAMTYGNVYVASVALGAKDEHTLKAFVEAEAYDGPALIIAYSHCISHGINMAKGLQQQKAWVDSGRVLLYRYNPDLARQGKNPLIVEGKGPKGDLRDVLLSENRFKLLAKTNKEGFEKLLEEAQKDVWHRWNLYQSIAGMGSDKPAE